MRARPRLDAGHRRVEADHARGDPRRLRDPIEHELLRGIGRDLRPDELHRRGREDVRLRHAAQRAARRIDARLDLRHVAGQARAEPVHAVDAAIPELVLEHGEVVAAGEDDADVRVAADRAVDPALVRPADALRVCARREPREAVRPELERKPREQEAQRRRAQAEPARTGAAARGSRRRARERAAPRRRRRRGGRSRCCRGTTTAGARSCRTAP